MDLGASCDGTGLDVRAELVPGALHLALSGSAEMVAAAPLEIIILRVHDEAVRAALPAVVVDVRQLEFMAASCFKALVTWISAIRDLPAGAQYRVTFRSSKARLWQRRSMHVLTTFATDLVTIES